MHVVTCQLSDTQKKATLFWFHEEKNQNLNVSPSDRVIRLGGSQRAGVKCDRSSAESHTLPVRHAGLQEQGLLRRVRRRFESRWTAADIATFESRLAEWRPQRDAGLPCRASGSSVFGSKPPIASFLLLFLHGNIQGPEWDLPLTKYCA